MDGDKARAELRNALYLKQHYMNCLQKAEQKIRELQEWGAKGHRNAFDCQMEIIQLREENLRMSKHVKELEDLVLTLERVINAVGGGVHGPCIPGAFQPPGSPGNFPAPGSPLAGAAGPAPPGSPLVGGAGAGFGSPIGPAGHASPYRVPVLPPSPGGSPNVSYLNRLRPRSDRDSK